MELRTTEAKRELMSNTVLAQLAVLAHSGLGSHAAG